jgi:hypothetical protein
LKPKIENIIFLENVHFRISQSETLKIADTDAIERRKLSKKFANRYPL